MKDWRRIDNVMSMEEFKEITEKKRKEGTMNQRDFRILKSSKQVDELETCSEILEDLLDNLKKEEVTPTLPDGSKFIRNYDGQPAFLALKTTLSHISSTLRELTSRRTRDLDWVRYEQKNLEDIKDKQ
jgi:hypothetical protein